MYRELTCRSTERPCALCGVPFLPRSAGGKPQRYHSEECRAEAGRAALRAKRPRKFPTLASRFWRHVDVRGPDECWPWKPGHARVGEYGAFGVGGSRAKGGYMTTAHRVALALHRGVPVEEIASVVRHSCDNPPCQNPAHLDDGTQAENLEDMRLKGRRKRTGPPGGELTEAAVREIRLRYAAGGVTQQALAEVYGVAQSTVRRVIVRQIWRHVL